MQNQYIFISAWGHVAVGFHVWVSVNSTKDTRAVLQTQEVILNKTCYRLFR